MLHDIKNNLKSILRYFPPVKQFLSNRYRQQFETEFELIQGIHENSNEHPSIIHFSINRAATQYVKSILKRCAIEDGIEPVRIHDYAFHTDFPYLDQLSAREMKKYNHIFKSKGYLYSVFGGMVEGIPNLEDYKIVLVTRDPRDILVSKYYSIAYSHPAPSTWGDKHDEFIVNKNTVRESTIDEYVLSESKWAYEIFSRYKSLLLDNYDNTYLTTYEQMATNFEVWLNDLISYCELDLNEEFYQSLLRENEAKKPKGEDVTRHNRKGVPGDYKEKLQPETIRKLNKKFDPILECFNYK